jgi:N-acyl-D-amino-acid deacylase
MFDAIIKNCRVIDGTGAAAYPADIVIDKGLIADISPLQETTAGTNAKKAIDATDLILSPGFIDMHTHSDFTLLLEPKADSKIRQGVTTEVTGNCGGSTAPMIASGRKDFVEYMTHLGQLYSQELPPETWNWDSLDTFFTQLTATGSAVNIVSLVGHSTLRSNVMGYKNRCPNPDEMALMKHLLESELEKGAFGLSSGLIYHPGAFAQSEELEQLALVVKKYNGIYSTHMRSEGRFLFDAVDEALGVAEKSGVSLEISHLKCETPVFWGKAPLILEKMNQARKKGLNVNFDQYPYTAYGTGLLEIFPVWAKENGATKMIAVLNDPESRQKVIHDMMHPPLDWDNPMEGLNWDQVLISGFTQPEYIALNGLTVTSIAEKLNLDPLEALFRVFCREKRNLNMIVFSMSEQDLMTILKDPAGMIGSDGCSVSPDGTMSGMPVHPRFYGTFPRILARYVREKKVISLEQAIRKMTGLPAKKLGLKNRGLIKKGMAADVVLFDPAKVADKATFNNPHQYPSGIEHVFVNGKAVIQNSEHTGKLPGQRLLREA